MSGKAATERLKLLIAYDGRPYRGWQSQTAKNGVQDFIEGAFARIVGERVVVHGSGRTDTGVHALGQVAHADVPLGKLTLTAWGTALNANLPPEIRILRIRKAPAGFHARFDACGKIYTYRVYHGPMLHPLEVGRAWHLHSELDLELLRDCAAKLLGEHDFAGFAASRGRAEDTVRTLRRIDVKRRGSIVTLTFEGSGFLYRMVRLLTGTLMRCAQHRAPAAWIDELLAGKGRIKTSFAAPADGLYLTRVLY
jgi:tRNA pseudouridine38-40 synthase